MGKDVNTVNVTETGKHQESASDKFRREKEMRRNPDEVSTENALQGLCCKESN